MSQKVTADDLALATFPPVQPFSANYKLTQLRTIPREHPYARINAEFYQSLMTRSGRPDPMEKPLVLRRPGSGSHFIVYGDVNVAGDTIELPEDMVQALRAQHLPERLEYLLATPEHTARLKKLSLIGEAVVDG